MKLQNNVLEKDPVVILAEVGEYHTILIFRDDQFELPIELFLKIHKKAYFLETTPDNYVVLVGSEDFIQTDEFARLLKYYDGIVYFKQLFQ